MESVIDTDAALDYVEFQLFPNHDRYEACACSGNTIETIASGLLGQLVLHIPRLKDLFSRGSKATFQIQCPENLDSSQWFTKSTVTRFLHVVGSVNILNTTTSILNEITQLEEAKKFHLSLYAKDESEIATSDASKHELLRAMELRLTTLKTELANAVNRAAGSSCTPTTICNMEKLAQHLGDINLRNTFRKFLEHSPMDQKVDLPINSNNDTIDKSDEKSQPTKPSGLDTPVKYGVSPAKAAEIERQSSTESDKSSDSSEDDQPSGERSRSFARVASPRRTASPMRRVQIGRSGSRRETALTIKSLNIFPGRDRTQSYRDTDAYSSEEEGSKNPPKKSDNNAMRISVRDAISLFENKQNTHTSDAQKKRSTLDADIGQKKSVLRRWSSGVEFQENVSESSSQLNSENVEVETPDSRVEVKTDDIIHGDNKPVEDAKVDEIFNSIEERMSKPIDNQPDILVIQHEEDTENLTASSEWNRRKEAELNEMITKMTQSNLGRNRNTQEKRGGFNDQYKAKKAEKIVREKEEKRAEKDAKFKAMQQVLEQRKATIASANSTPVTRSKSSLSNPEKLRKNSTQFLNSKKETPKPVLAKKASSKTPPSSVRKSWSSTPSPRAISGVSPAKTPCGTSSAGTTPTRRKSQQGPIGPTVPQPSPKVERPKPKPVTDSRKSTKGTVEKQPPPTSKNIKYSKIKPQTNFEMESSKDVGKPSLYSKVTKKSSVVPLESKPFLRKGTGPVVKTNASSPPKEHVKEIENPIMVEEIEVNNDSFDSVSQQILDENLEKVDTTADLQSEARLTTHQLNDKFEYCEQVITNFDEFKTEAEEDLTISPAAWVEIEEHENSCIPQNDNTCENSSIVNLRPVATASPRVRHSLSQMLLKESELDLAEWGSAEIIPSIVYQKEAPKGLKKLLKFSRKSKGDQNSTGWSTPSVFSEGEDDTEEFKALHKKNADISLRKATLHATNHGLQKTLLDEGHEIDFAGPQRLSAHLKLNNFSTQSSSDRLHDHISNATTTKATRSFFSLSAFRGNKQMRRSFDK